ncbi:hypothetical protein OG438_02210 [Streptomyces sp. NBC_00035]
MRACRGSPTSPAPSSSPVSPQRSEHCGRSTAPTPTTSPGTSTAAPRATLPTPPPTPSTQLELYSGYGWDGDDHWTPAAVRAWWRDRGRVRDWALAIAADWGADTHPDWGINGSAQYRPHYHDAAQGHLDFVAYIDDGLEAYLRGYVFWLDKRRAPRRWEALPVL